MPRTQSGTELLPSPDAPTETVAIALPYSVDGCCHHEIGGGQGVPWFRTGACLRSADLDIQGRCSEVDDDGDIRVVGATCPICQHSVGGETAYAIGLDVLDPAQPGAFIELFCAGCHEQAALFDSIRCDLMSLGHRGASVDILARQTLALIRRAGYEVVPARVAAIGGAS